MLKEYDLLLRLAKDAEDRTEKKFDILLLLIGIVAIFIPAAFEGNILNYSEQFFWFPLGMLVLGIIVLFRAVNGHVMRMNYIRDMNVIRAYFWNSNSSIREYIRLPRDTNEPKYGEKNFIISSVILIITYFNSILVVTSVYFFFRGLQSNVCLLATIFVLAFVLQNILYREHFCREDKKYREKEREYMSRLELYRLIDEGLADRRADRYRPAADVFRDIERTLLRGVEGENS
jgi:hypothetical protein